MSLINVSHSLWEDMSFKKQSETANTNIIPEKSNDKFY